ncbi:hypothetical protein B5F89_03445 [Collinsella sp. An307]|nr:hypothetical protein B5F89_03445 [Collinsella sp. An307]
MGAPQRILLVHAKAPADSPEPLRELDQAAGLLLDDFAEAFAVYARLSAAGHGNAAAIPSLQRISLPDMSTGTQGALGETGRFDAAVIGFAAECPHVPELSHMVVPGARVYAVGALADVAASDGADQRNIDEAFGALAQACRRDGLAWSGHLAVASAEVLPRLTRSPRMGMFRRPVSEAIDRLILSVRTASPFASEAVRPGACRLARRLHPFRR